MRDQDGRQPSVTVAKDMRPSKDGTNTRSTPGTRTIAANAVAITAP